MKDFRNILCVAGFDEPADRLIVRAIKFAERHQAELTIMDVVDPPRSILFATGERRPDGQAIRRRQRQRRRQLTELVPSYDELIDIRLRSVVDVPVLGIVREVLRAGHDLVMRTCENPHWFDRVLGSDDMRLLRKCPCPVWLVGPSASASVRRVLVAVDVDNGYSEREAASRNALALKTLEVACSLAIAESAELHVGHAWQAMSASLGYPEMPLDVLDDHVERTRMQHQKALAELLRESETSIGRDAMSVIDREEHLVEGLPRQEIPALAARLDADLVVMGSVARSGVPGLLMGNTAESILNQLNCSVLVIKPEGFITPITVDQ